MTRKQSRGRETGETAQQEPCKGSGTKTVALKQGRQINGERKDDRMEQIKVWTKQHENVLKELNETGRYIARREYIRSDLQEHAGLVLEVYDWLVRHSPDAAQKPGDVEYPVWVPFTSEAVMLPSPGAVILELTLDPACITSVNIEKWGSILNYSYIPKDEADARRHQDMMEQYGVSDAKAYMSRFYPHLKREIIASWDRLFDDSVILGNDSKYGNIWEIRKEWVTQVIR